MARKIQHFKVVALPEVGVPSAFYYVLNEDTSFTMYLTDLAGGFHLSALPNDGPVKWSDIVGFYVVDALPDVPEANAVYYVTRGEDAFVEYITDSDGTARRAVSVEVTSPVVLAMPPGLTWTINHDLGRQPASVTLLTPGGVEILSDVVHVSVNQCVASFASPQAGRAVVF